MAEQVLAEAKRESALEEVRAEAVKARAKDIRRRNETKQCETADRRIGRSTTTSVESKSTGIPPD
jgi:hypothetical protein